MCRLFGGVLTIKLPTTSLGVLCKFTVHKLRALESKAVATTTAFRSLMVSFTRFLVLHYHDDVVVAAEPTWRRMQLPFLRQNQLDVLVEALCSVELGLLSELWSMDKMKSVFEREYALKTKYKSSAFLKGCAESIGASTSGSMQSLHCRPSKRKRKRREFERRNKGDDEARFARFVEEECFLLLLDRTLPFLLDFDQFCDVLKANDFALFHAVLAVLNAILVHFVAAEKWWYLSRIMTVYHELFGHEALCREYRGCLERGDGASGPGPSRKSERARKEEEVALNVKYGILSFVIWICYHHQFTPKPLISLFQQKKTGNNTESDPFSKGRNGEYVEIETLDSVKERVAELSIAKAVCVQLLVTTVC